MASTGNIIGADAAPARLWQRGINQEPSWVALDRGRSKDPSNPSFVWEESLPLGLADALATEATTSNVKSHHKMPKNLFQHQQKAVVLLGFTKKNTSNPSSKGPWGLLLTFHPFQKPFKKSTLSPPAMPYRLTKPQDPAAGPTVVTLSLLKPIQLTLQRAKEEKPIHRDERDPEVGAFQSFF